MKKEIWKDVDGYEGFYQISNLGRVRSIGRYVRANLLSNVREVWSEGIILKPFRGQSGRYFLVELHKRGVGTKYPLHKLVWQHFGDGTVKGVIDHIDNNRENNSIDNLQKISQRENASKNSSGKNKLGVHKPKHTKKYSAKIYFNKRQVHLGYFDTEDQAHNAYLQTLNRIQTEEVI